MKDYTREDLIKYCDKCVVPYKEWSNRDSFAAQQGVGTIRQLLLDGCEFKIFTSENTKENDLKSDDHTIWIGIFHYEFEDEGDWQTYYLPSKNRLKESKGKDWY